MCIYIERERKRERAIFHPLGHFPNGHNGWALVRPKAGPRRDSSTQAIFCCSSRHKSSEQDWK